MEKKEKWGRGWKKQERRGESERVIDSERRREAGVDLTAENEWDLKWEGKGGAGSGGGEGGGS